MKSQSYPTTQGVLKGLETCGIPDSNNYEAETLAMLGGPDAVNYKATIQPDSDWVSSQCEQCLPYLQEKKESLYTAAYRCGPGGGEKEAVQMRRGRDVIFDCEAENKVCESAELRVYDTGLVEMVRGGQGEQRSYGGDKYKPGISVNKYASGHPSYEGQGKLVAADGRGPSFTSFSLLNGKTLQLGEFIGSPQGTFYLLLDKTEDGSVVLVPARQESACKEEKTGDDMTNTARDNSVVAPYQLSDGVVDPDKAGEMAYVNTYDTLKWYGKKAPIGESSNYHDAGKYTMSGDSVRPLDTVKGTAEDCKRKCNDLDDCYGYVHQDGQCKLYGDDMYPNTLDRLGPVADASMHVRLRNAGNPGEGCSERVVGGVQSGIAGLKSGSPMTETTKCSLAGYTAEEAAMVAGAAPQYEEGTKLLAAQASQTAGYNAELEDAAREQQEVQNATGKDMSDVLKKRDEAFRKHETVLGMDESAALSMLSSNYQMLMWMTIGVGAAAFCLQLTR